MGTLLTIIRQIITFIIDLILQTNKTPELEVIAEVSVPDITPYQLDNILDWFKWYYKSKGYKWEEFNVIGIRNPDNQDQDIFNDNICGATDKKLHQFVSTTDPGKYWTQNPYVNTAGSAHLAEGYYKDTYKIGNHRGEEALVQWNGEVTVWRDADKNYKQTKVDVVESGYFGINIHYSKGDPKYIGRWSAGCSVIQKRKDWNKFLKLAKASGQTSFSYLLITFEDIPEYLRDQVQ